MSKDGLDALGEVIEALFSLIKEEEDALNWRINKPAKGQSEHHFLQHRLDRLNKVKQALLQRLERMKNGDWS